MAHVVLFALHSFRVNLGLLAAQNLVGKLGRRGLGLLVGLGLDEHLPKTLGSQVVEALVGGGITEDVGDSFAKLLDGNGKAIGLVVLNHGKEGVTETG